LKRRTVHYTVCGLDYIYLDNAPVRQTSYGEVLAADVSLIEKDIAREIIRQGIPIRGVEVQFLRKSHAFSLAKFGNLLGLSAPAILKWERNKTKRLDPINEVAVRAAMAEQLDIEIAGRFTVLKGVLATPSRLSLKVA
jgi:DNA-binding transcriptional regulator YiaG